MIVSRDRSANDRLTIQVCKLSSHETGLQLIVSCLFVLLALAMSANHRFTVRGRSVNDRLVAYVLFCHSPILWSKFSSASCHCSVQANCFFHHSGANAIASLVVALDVFVFFVVVER